MDAQQIFQDAIDGYADDNNKFFRQFPFVFEGLSELATSCRMSSDDLYLKQRCDYGTERSEVEHRVDLVALDANGNTVDLGIGTEITHAEPDIEGSEGEYLGSALARLSHDRVGDVAYVVEIDDHNGGVIGIPYRICRVHVVESALDQMIREFDPAAEPVVVSHAW